MKRVPVYYVVKKQEEYDEYLTLVKNKKDAYEYTLNYLRLEYANHFNSWCEARNLDKHSTANFQRYLVDCIGLDYANTFKLKKVYFSLSDITEALRILCGFSPLGLSYEGPMETSFIISTLQENNNPEAIERLTTQAKFNPLMEEIITVAKGDINGKQ